MGGNTTHWSQTDFFRVPRAESSWKTCRVVVLTLQSGVDVD